MKRARVLIHLVVFALAPLAPATTIERDAIFATQVGHDCFRDLLKKAAWGLSGPFERAAWIVETSDGSFACQEWPSTNSYLSESFYGIIPTHAVGIVHTHPVAFPMPSFQDRREATRLGMPIYVVTIRGVYKAVPGAPRVATLADEQSWTRTKAPATFTGSAVASR